MDTQQQKEFHLPQEINGWKYGGKNIISQKEKLYRYINGAAELYISYGWKQLQSHHYKNEENVEIQAEIFEMSSPEMAYGVFSHARDKENEKIGNQAQYIENSLIFWKGKFYISIMTNQQTPKLEAEDTILQLGKEIQSNIKEAGQKPGLVNDLPSEGLITEKIIYFVHPAWQNTYFYITDQNILKISTENQAILTHYLYKNMKFVVLLVSYSNDKQAENAKTNFYEQLVKSNRGPFYTDSWKWSQLDQVDNYLLGVFKGKTKEDVNHFFTNFQDKLKNLQN